MAQVAGDRGIAPVVSSSDIDVGGIEVDVRGDTAEEARTAGWREAQRKAWEELGGPSISDSQVSTVRTDEDRQISTTIATMQGQMDELKRKGENFRPTSRNYTRHSSLCPKPRIHPSHRLPLALTPLRRAVSIHCPATQRAALSLPFRQMYRRSTTTMQNPPLLMPAATQRPQAMRNAPRGRGGVDKGTHARGGC